MPNTPYQSQIPILYIANTSLSSRAQNALERAGVGTVLELQQLYVAGKVSVLRNVGEKILQEIADYLENEKWRQDTDYDSQSFDEINTNTQHELAVEITEQISSGRLHGEATFLGKTLIELAGELNGSTKFPPLLLNELKIELKETNLERDCQHLVEGLSERELVVVTGRYGETKHKLAKLAAKLGITRERVRQLEAFSLQYIARQSTLHHLISLKSAILFGLDAGQYFNLSDWFAGLRERRMLKGGSGINEKPVVSEEELLLSVCRALSDATKREFISNFPVL